MPSREQTAEAHSIESRGKRSPRLTPRTSTSTPYERQAERDDHHDGDDAAALRLLFDTALSERLDRWKLDDPDATHRRSTNFHRE
jgi:hypothetical protein